VESLIADGLPKSCLSNAKINRKGFQIITKMSSKLEDYSFSRSKDMKEGPKREIGIGVIRGCWVTQGHQQCHNSIERELLFESRKFLLPHSYLVLSLGGDAVETSSACFGSDRMRCLTCFPVEEWGYESLVVSKQ